MDQNLKVFLIGLTAAVVFVAVPLGIRSILNERAWEVRVDSVQTIADRELERSRVLEALAERWEARAHELAATAEEIQNRADREAATLSAERGETAQRVREVQAETPDDLRDHPAIVQRDEIITELSDANVRWELAYGKLSTAYDTLSTAYTLSVTRGDSLRAALYAATAAADSLNAVLDDRPGRSPWWRPEIGLGPSVGLQADGTTYAGVGVHLHWEIPFG